MFHFLRAVIGSGVFWVWLKYARFWFDHPAAKVIVFIIGVFLPVFFLYDLWQLIKRKYQEGIDKTVSEEIDERIRAKYYTTTQDYEYYRPGVALTSEQIAYLNEIRQDYSIEYAREFPSRSLIGKSISRELISNFVPNAGYFTVIAEGSETHNYQTMIVLLPTKTAISHFNKIFLRWQNANQLDFSIIGYLLPPLRNGKLFAVLLADTFTVNNEVVTINGEIKDMTSGKISSPFVETDEIDDYDYSQPLTPLTEVQIAQLNKLRQTVSLQAAKQFPLVSLRGENMPNLVPNAGIFTALAQSVQNNREVNMVVLLPTMTAVSHFHEIYLRRRHANQLDFSLEGHLLPSRDGLCFSVLLVTSFTFNGEIVKF